MLAHEAHDAAPVPQRPAGEEAHVRLPPPPVVDDGGRDIPALPACLRCAVADVDVLTVEPEARVEAAELLEHPAPEQEETAEQPVGAHRLGGILVEVVVRT